MPPLKTCYSCYLVTSTIMSVTGLLPAVTEGTPLLKTCYSCYPVTTPITAITTLLPTVTNHRPARNAHTRCSGDPPPHGPQPDDARLFSRHAGSRRAMSILSTLRVNVSFTLAPSSRESQTSIVSTLETSRDPVAHAGVAKRYATGSP